MLSSPCWGGSISKYCYKHYNSSPWWCVTYLPSLSLFYQQEICWNWFFFLNFHLPPLPPHTDRTSIVGSRGKIQKNEMLLLIAWQEIKGRGSSYCSTSLAAYHSHFSNFLWLACHLDVIYIFCNHIVCMHGENDSYFFYLLLLLPL